MEGRLLRRAEFVEVVLMLAETPADAPLAVLLIFSLKSKHGMRYIEEDWRECR